MFTFRWLLLMLSIVVLNFNTTVAWGSLASQSLAPSVSKLYDRGKQYFEAQEYSLAIQSFLKLLEIEPNNAGAYNQIGMSWGELKKYPAAISAFNRAIALDASFANAYYNRGHIYQQLEKYDLALVDFDRALTLTKGQHVSALINRASVYALQADYQLALIDLEKVVELNPKLATAYYNRALINLTIGNKTAYLNDLTTAEKLYRQQGDISGVAQINRIKQLY